MPTRPDWHAHTAGEVSISAATATTVLQVLMPARRCVARGLTVSFTGQLATSKPVLVELVRLSSTGTMDPGVSSEHDLDAAFTDTLTVTQKAATGHAEPTVVEVARVYSVHPQMGFESRFSDEEAIVVAASGRIGVRCTAAAAVGVVAGLDIGRELATSRAETLAVTGASTTVLSPERPIGNFALQVSQVGGTATSWTVVLEGSLDGTNFAALTNMSHTKAGNGNGGVVFSGTAVTPVLHYRANVTALTLGSATAIAIAYAGMNA